jgi:myo-inositol 2-dehydrogenase/D-chiro-inositol 1-dehydrogenase
MLDICIFGAGRIAKIHGANVARHGQARVRYVCDVKEEYARALAEPLGAEAITNPERALADGQVNAVVVASSTDTHVDLVLQSARAGKAIFCEKPVDLDLGRVEACLAELEQRRIPMFVAFNRRYDPNFAALKARLRGGELGRLEMISITSRDPAPPPVEYVKVSGGLFRDMMIHDFDMARWLLGEEPVELYATASALVDPAIGEAGDVDTAMVTMKTASGVLCHINNSRRAVYGYDQRVEVFGERGMVQAGNPTPTTLSSWTEAGLASDKPFHFFLERYAEAYRTELDHFIEATLAGQPYQTDGQDGRQALLLADCAQESFERGLPVKLPV